MFDTIALFPVRLGGAVPSVAYTAPAAVARHLIAGLTPGAFYDVVTTAGAGGTHVTVTPGKMVQADIGGVLSLGFRRRHRRPSAA